MEWQILIVGGGTLIGFIMLIMKPIVQLNQTLTLFKKFMEDMTDNYKILCHDTDDIYDKLTNHEYRIQDIERHHGGEK